MQKSGVQLPNNIISGNTEWNLDDFLVRLSTQPRKYFGLSLSNQAVEYLKEKPILSLPAPRQNYIR
ncbi:hypothetical protein AM501_05255 [Aneurinibacillus migulanus]|uniref:hypothetical protein n=1 Tax=Aneurinibacillus migulanus TaxID=47500 RepID=UPI0005B827F4|nr:hypothetical protein [Aneurinibacillus migulanus]KIV58584.1 hypothetical protein TS64_04360 [Aneurinibacillus migulanus]KPD09244.1 hypothetical protein AM501_05255 [Aneurinibacillus migulanus]